MPHDAVPSTLYATGTVELTAAAADAPDGPQAFRMNAYNGGAMRVGGWPEPVVIDLAGMKVTAKSRPVLRDHDAGKIVGHTSEVDIQPKKLDVAGVLSADNLFSREVAASAKNGFPWQSSVGASVEKVVFVEDGETVSANGRTFTGPLYLVRRSRLNEVSFVALGADDSTSARLAASAAEHTVRVEPMTLEQFAEKNGFVLANLDEKQTAFVKASFDAEQAKAAVTQGNARVAATQSVNSDTTPPPQVQATKKTLEQIFEEDRKEQERQDEITRITAEALKARPFMRDELKRMSAAAIEAKTDVLQYEVALMRTCSAPAPVAGRRRDRKASEKTISAALCIAGGLEKAELEKAFDEQTLEAAEEQFPQGIGLGELLLMAARENGYTDLSTRNVKQLLKAALPDDVKGTGFSTFSLSGILGSTANKFLAAGFMAVESTWREIAAIRSVKDFKTITSYSLTGGMIYEEVGADGELKHATLGEQSYTNRVKTYGRMFAITRQDIINDDLDALTAIPRKLGRGAALKLNDVFWTLFLNNSAFFTSGRGNYTEGSATALSIDALTTGEALFLNMTDPDGYPMAITPAILLVPNVLNVAGSQLMNSTTIVDGSATAKQPNTNPHAGKFRVVRSSYLSNSAYTGYSTTAWYLLADPSDMPVVEVAFLNGKDTPTVESADADFDQLGVQFRGYHDFGVAFQEYRGGVKVKGAA